jgi:hypothetical protein
VAFFRGHLNSEGAALNGVYEDEFRFEVSVMGLASYESDSATIFNSFVVFSINGKEAGVAHAIDADVDKLRSALWLN